MAVEYDVGDDSFVLRLTRNEVVDLVVLFGLKDVKRVLDAASFGEDLPARVDDLRESLEEHPRYDACHWCLQGVVYVEGQWRHTRTSRAKCGSGFEDKTATPQSMR